MPLRKLPESFGLSAHKSWYPHFFHTRTNLNYVGQIPDVSLYGVDEMSASERQDFLAWYDREKDRVIDNRRVLEDYCQDDCTVLREACTIFRRDFIEIGNIEVFLEAYTIASVCNKVRSFGSTVKKASKKEVEIPKNNLCHFDVEVDADVTCYKGQE